MIIFVKSYYSFSSCVLNELELVDEVVADTIIKSNLQTIILLMISLS